MTSPWDRLLLVDSANGQHGSASLLQPLAPKPVDAMIAVYLYRSLHSHVRHLPDNMPGIIPTKAQSDLSVQRMWRRGTFSRKHTHWSYDQEQATLIAVFHRGKTLFPQHTPEIVARYEAYLTLYLPF